MKKIPAVKKLMKTVGNIASTGKMPLPDGRYVTVRHQHAALNTLLQGSGAICAKVWVMYAKENLDKRFKGKWNFLLNVHDEVQIEFNGTREEAEEAAKIITDSSLQAGEKLNIKVPVASEAKIGKSWAETH